MRRPPGAWVTHPGLSSSGGSWEVSIFSWESFTLEGTIGKKMVGFDSQFL